MDPELKFFMWLLLLQANLMALSVNVFLAVSAFRLLATSVREYNEGPETKVPNQIDNVNV